MENHTAKHFVLQLGSLICLYVSIAAFLVLTFGLINLEFPDKFNALSKIESTNSIIRIGFAMVLVFFPSYLVLMRMSHGCRRENGDARYSGSIKWLIYVSLLVGGLVLLTDFVVVLIAFLEAELTTRFILKALAVFLVVGFAFFYYVKDVQGYWLKNKRHSLVYGIVAAMLVSTVLIFSLAHIKTPSEVRELNIDEKQIEDLYIWQRTIEAYLQRNRTLPKTIEEAFAPAYVLQSPEGRAAYQYKPNEAGFELCAEFSTRTPGAEVRKLFPPEGNLPRIENPNDWHHGAGYWCFKKNITGGNYAR